jgi:hypothetical protein
MPHASSPVLPVPVVRFEFFGAVRNMQTSSGGLTIIVFAATAFSEFVAAGSDIMQVPSEQKQGGRATPIR